MVAEKSKNIISNRQPVVAPVSAGTGTSRLAPPWSREQVNWIGRGVYVLRLATEETSRWLMGASYSWNDAFPHEKIFRRSSSNKATVMESLRMNPWPVHMATDFDADVWRADLAAAVANIQPVFDTGHIALWRLAEAPKLSKPLNHFVVLDGHHSRMAQRSLGLKRLFGWVEPLDTPQLKVGPIHRSGTIAHWLKSLVESGELRKIDSAPDLVKWTMPESTAFEVVQADRSWWCEVARPAYAGEAAIDALVRLARGKVFMQASPNFNEILGWLEKTEVDTALRLPPPTKDYILKRALSRNLFPQKATYFTPKIPFGLLVEDLKI